MEPNVEAALAAYERARLERTAALVAGSRKAAKAALLQSRLGQKPRNALVSRTPESTRLRQIGPYVAQSQLGTAEIEIRTADLLGAIQVSR